jgi:predicted nucleotidyltransferase
MDIITQNIQTESNLISDEVIDHIVRTISSIFSPYKIILFGSYANGMPTQDSDLDLLIVMRTQLPSYKRAVPIKLCFNPYPCSMDILVFTPEEIEYWNGTPNHIITEAFSTGKVLYER